MTSEFLKHHARTIAPELRASLFPTEYREYIIREANRRTFYLVCNGHYKRAKLAGIKRQFPLVVAEGQYVEIPWQIAKEIANGIKSYVSS